MFAIRKTFECLLESTYRETRGRCRKVQKEAACPGYLFPYPQYWPAMAYLAMQITIEYLIET